MVIWMARNGLQQPDDATFLVNESPFQIDERGINVAIDAE